MNPPLTKSMLQLEKENGHCQGHYQCLKVLALSGVVLVHDSGPNDRDESIGPNKIFRDIAWGLASQGISVLRYDKRTLKHVKQLTPELIAEMTVKEEVIEDALLALKLMRQTNRF